MSHLRSHIDETRQAIILAISTHRVVQLKLISGWRTVEPYQLIICTENRNNILLYAYCRDTITTTLVPSRWQYFQLPDVKQIEVTNYYFEPLIEYYDQALANEQITLIAIEPNHKNLYD